MEAVDYTDADKALKDLEDLETKGSGKSINDVVFDNSVLHTDYNNIVSDFESKVKEYLEFVDTMLEERKGYLEDIKSLESDLRYMKKIFPGDLE